MVRRIDGQRLDVVLQKLRDRDAATEVLHRDEFRTFFNKDKRDHPIADRSPEALLVDFIMPMISDAGIFQDNQVITLLEYLRDDVLHLISENPEVSELATKVIDDEIARHQFVSDRRQSGIAV
jgi:DNA polymerase II small subunit/DNA polymerase delta subunit B